MREPDRIHRILNKLMQYWALHPDLRLGQIVMNAHRNSKCITAFSMEDSEFEFWLNSRLEKAEGGYVDGDSMVFKDKD